MDDVDRLRSLFRGSEAAHGVCIPKGTKDGRGKEEAEQFTPKEKVTKELWENHVNGIRGLGIIPIFDKDKCQWGCIDIDVYPSSPVKEILALVKKYNYPLNICRSKSGGLHVFLFTKEPVLAVQMQTVLASLASKLDQSIDRIFPMQEKVGPDGVGNWVNMPFFGNTRLGIGPKGEELGLKEFLDTVKWADLDALERALTIVKSPLGPEAPPCLQWMVENKIKPGMRNTFLANVAVLLKKQDVNDLQGEIRKANRFCVPELDEIEVQRTYKSIISKPYNYQCKQLPYCDKPTCLKRKYGIGNGIGGIDVELILKYQEDEEFVYEVRIKEKEKAMICNEEEYANQTKFLNKYLSYYDEIPNKMSQVKWAEHLNSRKDLIIFIPQEPGTGKADRLKMLVKRYRDRYLTQDQNEIRNDKAGAWIDKHDRVNFPKTHFLEWLQSNKQDFKPREIIALFKEMSGISDVSSHLKIVAGNKATTVRVYRVPLSCLDDYVIEDHDEGEQL